MQGVRIKSAFDVINAKRKSTGTTLTFVTQKTGLSSNVVYRGLGRSKRGYIRAEEFILYCLALGLKLEDFIERHDSEEVRTDDEDTADRD